MIPMRAKPNVASFSVGGVQFPVVNGVVQIPPPYVKHALAHGFKLLEGQNADELIAGDLEAALAKAQAAIPVRGLQVKKDMASLNIDGVSYKPDDSGYVEVPEDKVGIAKMLGCTETVTRARSEEELEQIRQDKRPKDADGLFLDGPTLSEFVKAGYKAENYPPQGYADKRTPEELKDALAAAAAASQTGKSDAGGSQTASQSDAPVLPTLAALKAMSDADLRTFMKDKGVEFLGDAKRKDMDKAAKEWLDKASEKKE